MLLLDLMSAVCFKFVPLQFWYKYKFLISPPSKNIISEIIDNPSQNFLHIVTVMFLLQGGLADKSEAFKR